MLIDAMHFGHGISPGLQRLDECLVQQRFFQVVEGRGKVFGAGFGFAFAHLGFQSKHDQENALLEKYITR